MATFLSAGFGDGKPNAAQFPSGIGPTQVDIYQYSVIAGWNGQFSDTFPTTLSGKTHTGPRTPGVIRINPVEQGNGTDPNQNTFWEAIDSVGNITSYTDTGFKANQGMILLATVAIPFAGDYVIDVASDDGYIMGWGDGPGTVTRVSGNNTNTIGQTQTANKGYAITAQDNASGAHLTDQHVTRFSVAGTYTLEVNWTNLTNANTLVVSIHPSIAKPSTTLTQASAGQFSALAGGYAGMTWMKSAFSITRDYWDPANGTPYSGQLFPTGTGGSNPGQVYPY